MTATNQLPSGVPASSQSQAGNGMYDPAGDLLTDGVNQYMYDAEGRVCAVASQPVAGVVSWTGYLYNAEGHRVAKGTLTSLSCNLATNGFTPITESVLGQSGEQLAELSSCEPTSPEAEMWGTRI